MSLYGACLFLQKRRVQDFYFLDSIQGFLQSQQSVLQVYFEDKVIGTLWILKDRFWAFGWHLLLAELKEYNLGL